MCPGLRFQRGQTWTDCQLWSIRFSADGKEIVAGASDGKIMVYDIEAQERSLSVPGHADDGKLPMTLMS